MIVSCFCFFFVLSFARGSRDPGSRASNRQEAERRATSNVDRGTTSTMTATMILARRRDFCDVDWNACTVWYQPERERETFRRMEIFHYFYALDGNWGKLDLKGLAFLIILIFFLATLFLSLWRIRGIWFFSYFSHRLLYSQFKFMLVCEFIHCNYFVFCKIVLLIS